MKGLGKPPYVCLITPGRSNADTYSSEKDRIVQTVREAAHDGVDIIQVREKDLPTRLVYDLVVSVKEVLAGTDVLVFVNDRVDVAIATGADGVHLPEAGLPPSVVRGVFGDILIGVSVHTAEGAEAAARDAADFVHYGPVFKTPEKGSAVGLGSLAEVCRRLPGFPVIALGGIEGTNCRETIEAGAAGIAAIRALNDTSVRRKILAELRPDGSGLR